MKKNILLMLIAQISIIACQKSIDPIQPITYYNGYQFTITPTPTAQQPTWVKDITKPISSPQILNLTGVKNSHFTFPPTYSKQQQEGKDVWYIAGDVNQDYTLTSDNIYYINGKLAVKEGYTLTIQAGTKIYQRSQSSSYILVEQGAKIKAQGTENAPIIITSDKDGLISTQPEPGDVAGLFLCGKAQDNQLPAGGLSTEEYTGANFGGHTNDDNSGTLQYLVIKYSGKKATSENESNGLTLAGVGNETIIDNLYITQGSDDGVEFFGGTVNITNITIEDVQDDAIDWTRGYAGHIDNAVVLMNDETDNGFEGDNFEANFAATPTSNPTITNAYVKFTGTLSSRGYALKLRHGTKGTFSNFTIEEQGSTLKGAVKVYDLSNEYVEQSNGLIITNLAVTPAIINNDRVFAYDARK